MLRKALARQIPPAQIPVAKKGFTVPLGRWLREDLRPVFEEQVLGPNSFPAGAFDRAELRTWFDGHLSGRLDRTKGLWNLLALQLWADRHCQPLPAPRRAAG